MSHTERRTSWQRETLIGLVAGCVYGGANVLIGHPFDTIKTKMQVQGNHMGRQVTLLSSARLIYKTEGLLGFYRGSAAIAAGTMAQRGTVLASYEMVYAAGESNEELKKTVPYSGGLQMRTILGGMTAGFVRSILECPFEYVKVRRMTEQSWHVRDLYKGFSTLAPRSTLILTSFFVSVDSM